MKKIININLSGRLIPIEDSAYDILKGYIESLRRYFSHEEGKDEIISDIESRIAELFQDKIKKGAHCITDEDVAEVMKSIGRPEDFEENEETSGSQSSSYENYTNAGSYGPGADTFVPKGRLSRNSNDKILGGVCSGIAHSLRIDPSLVRILFALITFGGFGLGFVAYIILWVVLPTAGLQDNIQKRLFRNPEEKVIGGVAGGLAAYFNVEVWIPRLIFAAPLIFNIIFGVLGNSWLWFGGSSIIFGSFTGTFLLAYIILWIVVPMASTTSERLQMKGQKVDLENIKNTVKEEMENLKVRAEKFGKEFKERADDFSKNKGKHFEKEVNSAANGFGHAIGVIFKAFFLFIAGIIAFALFIALIAIFTTGLGSIPFRGYFLSGTTQNVLAWVSLLFFLGVPIIALMIWLIRKIMGVKSQNSYLAYAFSTLWTIGLICAIVLISQIVRDFSTHARVKQEYTIEQPSSGKIEVKVPESRVKVYGGFWRDGVLEFTEDSMIVKSVRLRIVKSPDSLFHASAQKYGRGRTSGEAQASARNINYGIMQADSVVYLDNGFSINQDQKFRNQQVMVTLEVPIGKRVKVDRSVSRRLGWFSLDDEWEYDDNWDNYHRWESGVEYIMTIAGLERVDEKYEQSDDDEIEIRKGKYRYRGTPAEIDSFVNDAIELKNKALEEREKKLKEELKAIEEAKKSGTQNDNDRQEEPAAGRSGGWSKVSGNLFSPVLSLTSRL